MLPPLPLPVVPPTASYGNDSIATLEAAARDRLDEGNVLLNAGYNGGAVYLYGYTAEAILKAAWFRLLGHTPTQAITRSDLLQAAALASGAGLNLGNFHNIAAWVRWLVLSRLQTVPYVQPLQQNLLQQADLIHQYWTPEMRYQVVVIPLSEAQDVRDAATWVLGQYPNL